MADAAVSVEPVGRSKKDLGRFFNVADRVYAQDPHWVAPLRDDLAKVLSDSNPFFRRGERQLSVARKNGRDAGRIAAILDHNHNAFHGEKTGFFGYFESENDPAVSGPLFDAVESWTRERGMDTLRGPANPTLNDEAGLLVDGFDSSPVLMMTYNPRYYIALVERAGFRKAKDLLACWFSIKDDPLARLTKLAQQTARRETNVVVRKIS